MQIGTVRASPQIGEILVLWLFDCPVSPVLDLAPRSNRWTDFTVDGSNDVIPRKDGSFGVRMGDVIWGKYASPNLSEVGVNRQFQAKRLKYKNRNISQTINRI